jgi:diguanylate cyclase (GGDEF)-like protein/PAS domain S-box-containing protein
MSRSGVQRPGGEEGAAPGQPPGHGRNELFEISIDLLATLDRAGHFVDVNPAAERILGYTRNELIGMRAIDLLHPEDRERTLKLREPLAARSLPDVVEFENRYRRKDGAYRCLQWNARLVDNTWYAVGRDITDRRILEESAVRDPLTGLPNRVALTDRLRAAIKRVGHSTTAVAVLFVDLDQFKLVNDGRGHDVGDRFLCAAANRLLETVRAGDLVGRLGGDEFVILLEDVSSPTSVTEVSERVVDAFARPIEAGAEEAMIGASVGIAITTSPRITPRTLLRHADTAMYQAKDRGGGCYATFENLAVEQFEQAR